jgi:ABC-type antimicrobial peptide transport system permease subunit
MKILGLIGTIVGAIAGILGGYLQFVLVPEAELADARASSFLNETYFGSLQHQMDMATVSDMRDFGAMVMFAGLLAFLLSIFPAIKKQNIAWIGVVLGVLMFFLGAAHGTHMFS